MQRLMLSGFAMAMVFVASAQAQRISLWNDQAPVGDGKHEQADAWITVHRPDQGNGTAIVICPGGGYGGLVTGPEGHGIAEWLNGHGITGVVLEYRLPAGRPFVPLLDAQRAMRVVRANANEWKIEPARIGILGFSAGGHLASTAATHFDDGDQQAEDMIERVSCRPDFAILVYPVITMGKETHPGCYTNLLGQEPTAEIVALFSNDQQVTDTTPPTFLAHAQDDRVVSLENSRVFYDALRKHNIPTKLLELPSGDHGLNGYKGPMWDAWQKQSLDWLAELSLTSQSASPRAESVLRWQQDFAQLAFEPSPVLVGFASSMVKLLPRDVGFEVRTSKEVQLSLARNEKESFQVAVMPTGDGVKGVSVTVGDLTSESGQVFPRGNIDCDVMGYVETKTRPPYEVSHVGWWPDPILDFLGPVDIAAGDLQSFWIRVRAPRDQTPGMYRGTLTVSVAGRSR